MPQKYPTDRFDSVPADLQRAGAHRAPRPRGYGWVWVAWCALAVAVLVGAGAVSIFVINGSLKVNDPFASNSHAPSATATTPPTPTVVPTVNPTFNIIVLNGTTISGLANDATDRLVNAGWTKKNITPANANSTDYTTTTVFYANASDKAEALAVSQTLNNAPIRQTSDYAGSGAEITVVIGTDYKRAG